ncbi:MAG: zinc ribbon domain-containing protein [Candidatus Heimdallarchaeota archaeon]|nr:zinc ribbon domain-containing protein [Candidatus Heimdallarchaeota archaeon]
MVVNCTNCGNKYPDDKYTKCHYCGSVLLSSEEKKRLAQQIRNQRQVTESIPKEPFDYLFFLVLIVISSAILGIFLQDNMFINITISIILSFIIVDRFR